ncbi:TPA: hypothetical protein N2611_004575, partial [Escherichia coli]|nr:hypothetical protein [Escherichia coli]HCM0257062.1 hypothetical protein [Escherichia coli]HEL3077653.1 hypothetical protein [Escherichia coli]
KGCLIANFATVPKHGGYQPVAADDYAHWAPAEGEPGTTELMAWYAQAQVGDSTFAV